MSDCTIESTADGWTYRWAQWGVTASVARLAERHGQIQAELTVRAALRGADRLLTQGSLNLSAIQTRERLAKRLSTLYPGPSWDLIVETVCVRSVGLHREGQPSESLEPREGDAPAYYVCNPLIYEGHPTLLYGPAESGKSLFGLFVGCLLASGGTSTNLAVAPDGHEVLYLDWELRAAEMRARVQQLRRGHPELTRTPWHRAMSLPLAACAAEIRREIVERQIGVIVVDSLGPATGGEIERSTDPVAFFGALRSFGCASLLIGHIAKGVDEDRARTPYGSVYYTNLARSIWEIRMEGELDSAARTIGLYHRKNNLGRRLPSLGYSLTITEQEARFAVCDPGADPSLARGLSVPERLKRLLADGQPRTTEELAEALDVPAATVRQALHRYQNRWWTLHSAGGGRGISSSWVSKL